MTPRRRRLRVLMPAVAVVALLLVGAKALAAAGLACYVVSSPSMGTAAPVGSLVVTAPLGGRPAAAGEIVAFHPPGQPSAVYVHRVLPATGAGLRTQGDANPGRDAWSLRPGDLLGRAIAVLPGVGFAVRALPILLVGGVVVALVTPVVRDPALRSAARLLGASSVCTVAALQVRPFIGLVVVTASPTADGGVAARVVSTGLLPITVTGAERPVVLGPGSTAQLLLEGATSGARLHAAPALEWWQWGCVLTALLLPAAGSLLLARVHRARDEPGG